MDASYTVLGLPPTASKAEVKEAFVKLCKLHHPDTCAPDMRATATVRFKEIKSAYDTILKGQAGYAPPPPGSSANPRYAREYYRAHGMGMEYGEWGPVRCGGPYGGYATEMDFYRSMVRSSRNNPFLLILTGLICIPAIATMVSVINGNGDWIVRFRDQGLNMFSDNNFRVNGRETAGHNPFAIRGLQDVQNSYIYKDDKYAHLRRALGNVHGEPAADA